MDGHAMHYLALNQYRRGSSYKDEVGIVYHFPKRYLKRIQAPDARFVYYEPRAGGDQVYFGTGQSAKFGPIRDEQGHYYSEILEYYSFPEPVSYWAWRQCFEPARTMRNSVRPIDKPSYDAILQAAGFSIEDPLPASNGTSNLNDAMPTQNLKYSDTSRSATSGRAALQSSSKKCEVRSARFAGMKASEWTTARSTVRFIIYCTWQSAFQGVSLRSI